MNPTTGAPTHAILLTFLLAAGLTLTGTFEELAILSVIARFVQYIPTCIAVLVLRKRPAPEGAVFRLPLGPVLPVLTLVLCGWLLFNTDPSRLLYGGIALACGVPLYFAAPARRQKQRNQGQGPA